MVQKRATIKDIAEQAGVSGTTVSRYLNGKFNYMSEETKKRIEIIIDEVGYRPSNIARTLKSNKSKLVGAVIADIENPFSNKIIKGLTDKANELGYSLMISVSNNSVEKENESIARFLDNQVDGLIINTVGENEPTLKKIQKQIPLVLIDRDVTSFKADVVTSNNYELGIELMQHLLENGFKSISFFTEHIGNNTVRELRYRTFADTMKNNPQINGKTYSFDREDIDRVAEMLEEFSASPEPRVIFASNGLVQLSVLKAMRKKGLKFKDFSLCGYDDWDWTPLIGREGITALAQDSYGLGTTSMDLLIKRLEQNSKTKKPIKIKVPGGLVIRGSTKPK